MARRRLLVDAAVTARLAEIPLWSRKDAAIERTWTFEGFPEALAFINRVGELAEAADHHPDIHNAWNRVTLSLTTHDLGGLTDRDFDLAKKIDSIR